MSLVQTHSLYVPVPTYHYLLQTSVSKPYSECGDGTRSRQKKKICFIEHSKYKYGTEGSTFRLTASKIKFKWSKPTSNIHIFFVFSETSDMRIDSPLYFHEVPVVQLPLNIQIVAPGAADRNRGVVLTRRINTRVGSLRGDSHGLFLSFFPSGSRQNPQITPRRSHVMSRQSLLQSGLNEGYSRKWGQNRSRRRRIPSGPVSGCRHPPLSRCLHTDGVKLHHTFSGRNKYNSRKMVAASRFLIKTTIKHFIEFHFATETKGTIFKERFF